MVINIKIKKKTLKLAVMFLHNLKGSKKLPNAATSHVES